ncbi:MAG: aminopeptidase [Vicinamibacteria bacterium]
MRFTGFTAFSLGILVLVAASASSQNAPPRFGLDWKAMAKRIVEQLALEPGEKFLAVAHPGIFDELIPHLRYEVMKAGAVDLGVISVLGAPVPADWNEEVLVEGGKKARVELRKMLERVDASIMLPGANPGQPAYAAIQDLLREGMGRTVHFHWLENASAFPLPGQPLPARHEIEAAYQRALLETDYRALAERQRELEQAMRAGEVRVTTPAGTDLRFRIADRPVNFQDGNASPARAAKGVVLIDREIELPAGAVRVAPIEESVQGTIVFPPSQWSGRPVLRLKLGIVDGKVTSVEAADGKEWAEREMDEAGDAARSFREFALGLNPLLAVPEDRPWIPYYGYGAGVVRLSLGDNSELGGRVSGGYVRWNFFTDTTVVVNGEIWVADGKFVRR